jgi:hypothetical protein
LPNRLFTNNERFDDFSTGTGLLDMFDRYNFTVNEAEPLEKEVAIDPEMLGKVFENLIEENLRKGLGSYYTPREIVHYMCQESLIKYLDTALNTGSESIGREKRKQAELDDEKSEQTLLVAQTRREIVPLEDIETFVHLGDQISHYESVDTRYAIKMPKSIERQARLLDEKLADITICDPAVGSGAFPVGMMSEIVRARSALTPYFNDVHERTPYHFKRHAIQDCLYGVDVDPGAVEIAKLRLWLSLVVDEEDVKQIKPLPNLFYKIVTGNSLLGVEKNLFNQQLFRRLEELKPRYFDEPDKDKKGCFKQDIEDTIHQLTNGKEVFDFEIYFSEVFHRRGGFDVVIANPPYGLVGSNQVEARAYYTSGRFKLTAYKTNLYLLFLERGLELLNPKLGIESYIIPKSLVFNSYFKATRRKLLKEYSIPLIVEVRTKVFEAAEVGDSILFFGNARRPTQQSKLQDLVVEQVTSGSEIISRQSNPQTELAASIGARFRTSSIKIKKSAKTLGDLWEVSNGLNPGNVRHILLSDSKLSSKHRRMLLGRDIQRYLLKWSGTWVNFDPDLKERIKPSETRSKKGMTAQQRVDFALRSPEIYKPNKVIVRKTADHIVACFDPDGFCFDSLSYGIQPKSKLLNAKFLLGLLNSKFLGYLHAELSQNQDKVFAKVLAENIRKLPMPELDHELTDDRKRAEAIESLVGRILAAKARNASADVSTLEREIDRLVYALYGLTPEEIKIVEESTTKSS